MNEEERIVKINTASSKILDKILDDAENGTLDEDRFLAETYSRLVAASVLGFSPSALAKEAEGAAQRLLDLVKKERFEDEN